MQSQGSNASPTIRGLNDLTSVPKYYEYIFPTDMNLLPEEIPPFSQLVEQLQEYWEEEHASIYEIEVVNTGECFV